MVQVNDMYYAWSPNEEIVNNGECGGAVTSILKFLLEDSIVDAVLAVKKGSDIYDAVPTLVNDPKKIIETGGSLHCGTLNIAKPLEKYLNGSKDMKIAVTVKPCDAMSIVELIKRKRVDNNKLVMVGVNCGGTMPPVKAREMIEKFYKIDPDDVIKEEIAKGKLIIGTKDHEEQEIDIDELEEAGYGRRTNCRRCEINIPRMADLALGNWGVIGPLSGKATFIEVLTDKGADILDKTIKAGALRTKDPEPKGVEIRANIDKIMVKLAKKWQSKDFNQENELMDIDQYMDEFSKCIKCYGCREACPLCFCKECAIESDSPLWAPKGVIPPSPMFHWVRLIHIVDSCTNCGQCQEVCPAEIPLTKIYHKLNRQLQDVFSYRTGMDVTQKPPLSIVDKEPSEE
ncbi:Coenzyme F420 hydrogenase/dehydrogenase, beta subunit C-terminal domain [Methanobacterium paludis]|uniref:formate dehydrogenase (coenzyme F420) n=1 Tax=Methanobacterium paludis (strain DSM 25820 / JCM 18151 / SWAN1) TaxID=868131 RepID=F6D815_METPW|nr:Coenzyme F420 hydrogenase/dehydrogenase, beta subunit C-terminal domain [Methanobacterium paludis]AEG17160.1 Formate dehydrogenase [Methanobacterium paludis]